MIDKIIALLSTMIGSIYGFVKTDSLIVLGFFWLILFNYLYFYDKFLGKEQGEQA